MESEIKIIYVDYLVAFGEEAVNRNRKRTRQFWPISVEGAAEPRGSP
jgi:hypothetical protein